MPLLNFAAAAGVTGCGTIEFSFWCWLSSFSRALFATAITIAAISSSVVPYLCALQHLLLPYHDCTNISVRFLNPQASECCQRVVMSTSLYKRSRCQGCGPERKTFPFKPEQLLHNQALRPGYPLPGISSGLLSPALSRACVVSSLAVGCPASAVSILNFCDAMLNSRAGRAGLLPPGRKTAPCALLWQSAAEFVLYCPLSHRTPCRPRSSRRRD